MINGKSLDANIQVCQELLVQLCEQGVSDFFVLSRTEYVLLDDDGTQRDLRTGGVCACASCKRAKERCTYHRDGVVSSQDLLKMVNQRFTGASKVVQVKPDRLDFYFNYGLSRRLPVRMSGYVVPGKSYYLARTRFWPDVVTVYASKRILDSLRFVKTVPINIVNFGDTVIQTVALEKIKGVKIVPKEVRIGLYPDILTEETIDVPVKAINMPEGKVLRTFPSKVKVSFIVGASMFRSINADMFSVVVDYNELMEHSSDKCNIYLKSSPQSVRNASLQINQVDYLIEQQ